jgi:hypothetical protein
VKITMSEIKHNIATYRNTCARSDCYACMTKHSETVCNFESKKKKKTDFNQYVIISYLEGEVVYYRNILLASSSV